FGGVLGGGTGLDTPYRFTNQRSDESATGLYDYNARFYSPMLGRFVSADSIVPGAGNPQSLNRYSYVFNNPLTYTDPDGHDPKDDNGNSTNTCAYGYGCDPMTQMQFGRAAEAVSRRHYSIRRNFSSNWAENFTPFSYERDKSILLVPAVACAIAAPCGLAAINTTMAAGGHYASLSRGGIIAITGPQLPKNAVVGFAGELAGQILEMAWGMRKSGDFSFTDMVVSTVANVGTGAADNFIKPIGYAQRIRTALPKAVVATGVSYPTSTNPKNDLQMNLAVEYSAVILQITLESNGVSDKRSELLAESYKVGINLFIKYFQPKDK
ncbi:MAG: RHS repeat-associated core domain-containing protein, partial [Anaerolineae bacterium]|nr:RHS repeat-associated core domain-containing protein [Anaerolineae bacterium]